jgi:hypothetical protein
MAQKESMARSWWQKQAGYGSHGGNSYCDDGTAHHGYGQEYAQGGTRFGHFILQPQALSLMPQQMQTTQDC